MPKNNITIYTQTKDYIQALLETNELKAHKKAVEVFENDSEAKKLLADYAGDISQGINFPFVQPQKGGCCG